MKMKIENDEDEMGESVVLICDNWGFRFIRSRVRVGLVVRDPVSGWVGKYRELFNFFVFSPYFDLILIYSEN